MGANLKFKGLHTDPNLLALPEGAATQADNVVCRREDVAEPRRGVSAYATQAFDRLFLYGGTLIGGTNAGAYKYDNGSGTFTALTGTFAGPNTTYAKARSTEAAQDLFFTTSGGVYRMDSTSSTPALAGAIKAVGFERDGRLYSSTAGNMSLTGNVVSVTTSAAHGFYVGQLVTQTSALEAPYAPGNYTVLTVPSSTSFTYALTAGNDAANANTHTFAPSAVAVVSGGTHWLADGAQVAYRVVFNCPDANNTEKPGAASPKTVILNATGTVGWATGVAADVIVRAFVPSGITTSHQVRLYRSKQVASGIEPDDELQLVWQALVKQGEITAGYVDIIDVAPDALRGATIYVAPSQQGIAANNERPPLVNDVETFGGSVFYANSTGLHRQTLNLLSVTSPLGVVDGDDITIDNITYTAKTTPTTSVQFKLDTTSGAVGIRNTALNLCAAVNRDTSNNSSAFYVSGANDVPGQILIERKALGGSAFTPTTTGSRKAWSPLLNTTAETCDLSRTGSTVTATVVFPGTHNYLVGDTVTLFIGDANFVPGAKTIVSAPTNTTFTYTEAGSATTLAGQTFRATVSLSSTADVSPHRLYYSKAGLPEAVPSLNYFDLGSKNDDILRIVATRSSLFVFKEDGLWRVTGSNGQFGQEAVDPTIILLAPDSAVALGNQVYCLTTQGVLVVSDTGSEIISKPIEKTLLALQGVSLTNYKNLTFGVGRETEGEYELRLPTLVGDTSCTQAYIYNTRTSTWVRDSITAKSGVVSPSDDKRYLAGATQVLKERKDFAYTDYSDADISVTITVVATTSVTLSSATGVSVGDILVLGAFESRITAVNSNVLTVEASWGGGTGAATVKTGISSVVKWAPYTAGSPDTQKLFREATFLLGNAHSASATVSFSTELITSAGTGSVDLAAEAAQYTLASVHWDGTERPYDLRLGVTQEHRRASQLFVKWTHANAWAHYALNGLSIAANKGSDKVAK